MKFSSANGHIITFISQPQHINEPRVENASVITEEIEQQYRRHSASRAYEMWQLASELSCDDHARSADEINYFEAKKYASSRIAIFSNQWYIMPIKVSEGTNIDAYH